MKRHLSTLPSFSAFLIIILQPALALMVSANEAKIIDATATKTSDGTYRFNVTLKHQDSGWQHYANKWEVLSPSGKVLGSRTLYHPHVNEQPFTRSLSGVTVPEGLESVIIRAYDLKHGVNDKTFTLKLPRK